MVECGATQYYFIHILNILCVDWMNLNWKYMVNEKANHKKWICLNADREYYNTRLKTEKGGQITKTIQMYMFATCNIFPAKQKTETNERSREWMEKYVFSMIYGHNQKFLRIYNCKYSARWGVILVVAYKKPINKATKQTNWPTSRSQPLQTSFSKLVGNWTVGQINW